LELVLVLLLVLLVLLRGGLFLRLPSLRLHRFFRRGAGGEARRDGLLLHLAFVLANDFAVRAEEGERDLRARLLVLEPVVDDDAVRRIAARDARAASAAASAPAAAGHAPHHRRREQIRRSEEHTSELQSLAYLVCRLLHEKK